MEPTVWSIILLDIVLVYCIFITHCFVVLQKNTPNQLTARGNSSKKSDKLAVFDLTSPTLLSALAVVLYQLYRNPPTDSKYKKFNVLHLYNVHRK